MQYALRRRAIVPLSCHCPIVAPSTRRGGFVVGHRWFHDNRRVGAYCIRPPWSSMNHRRTAVPSTRHNGFIVDRWSSWRAYAIRPYIIAPLPHRTPPCHRRTAMDSSLIVMGDVCNTRLHGRAIATPSTRRNVIHRCRRSFLVGHWSLIAPPNSSSTRSTSSAELRSISSTSASHSRSPAQMRRVASVMRQPTASSCGSAPSTAARASSSPRAAATMSAMSRPCCRSMCQRLPAKAAKVARSRRL